MRIFSLISSKMMIILFIDFSIRWEIVYLYRLTTVLITFKSILHNFFAICVKIQYSFIILYKLKLIQKKSLLMISSLYEIEKWHFLL
ncbi:unnamed protein product [Blepharisma stoltei]|uniref:NADH dehydrogenase subunit 4L n=1 Tax=Blepharisma stoltei TaxID=1481888 RepID=A0AAU9J4M9_9CILI|nr:unnamed protein product [Blepharisma stoltei]